MKCRSRQYLALGALSALTLALAACGGGSSNPSTETAAPSAAADPSAAKPKVDFGPNVLIFDPGMDPAAIQTQVDIVYSQQHANQFGPNRYALMFKPGTYPVDVNVGFYTHVIGLGSSPDDVQVNDLHVEADWLNASQDATQNFWRSAENLSVQHPANVSPYPVRWAVSQAAPMRRVHIKGDAFLSSPWCGWSSGGFMADTLIDGQINSCSQQQWFSRNDEWTSWVGGVWNMVFVGVQNAPAAGTWPTSPYTVVAQTPVMREKPFLTIDGNGNYSVFVPALNANTTGTTWHGHAAAGTSLPISQFYIAKENVDTAKTINAALAKGLNLIFTPGVYHLTDTIRVTRADTVVLGLGVATLEADTGLDAMDVADVDGVKISGLLFEAGTTSSPALLKVGSSVTGVSHAADPICLYDIYARIGGQIAGKAHTAVEINANNVIGDDFWLWRADHGDIGLTTTGWTVNPAANGLVVNGDNVTMYGLAVEHFEQFQTLWNGNGGSVYFYQSEEPYDVPNQAAWMNGTENGYPSYKVADTVTTHKAFGVGIYGFNFVTTDRTVSLANAIEAPQQPGVSFTNLVTVALDGNSLISNVINNTGGSNIGQNGAVASYP
ncbi:coagulation factor 5/8 type domain-containing protein [Silvimonas iriomotensis]|uniref:Adenylyl cyclase n=1 Tax=Silvimonas iriomotensis TaxID=449662 RepID=A0ABQ2P797_9NEIS|nr:coagulation factor 5/8 type domain-containing protein [Silvimonas iriomotensis]GGP19405.1 hypothetical protein GCM10010970_10450 [Silvimonas iriomotensis]